MKQFATKSRCAICLGYFESVTFIAGFREFGAEKYFTDNRAANPIQLVVAIKGDFPGLIFFLKRRGILQQLVGK